MIKYNLICKCKKTFESWFPSSSEYEEQNKKKLIRCIFCNSASVKKTMMAPNLLSKSNKENNKIKTERNVKKQLLDIRKYVEKNCKDVGDNFSTEARKIHYDQNTSKGIYGKATEEETSELIEEGIEVATIPWINKNTEN